MAEFIDRNDAAQALCHRLNDAKIKGFVVSILMDVPAADVKPVVRGKWIFDDFDGDGFDYQCPCCSMYAKKPSNFCPNCGADMREADNG